MSPKTIIAASMVMLGMLAAPAFADERPQAPAADEIVKKANHAALYQGSDVKGAVSMIITDRQGRTRKRGFNMLRKDVGAGDGDQEYYVYFNEPADVRKMSFMVHKNGDPARDDDRWLYMPGLDLVKRIAAGDKRTSFVGSDYLYEDISGRSPLEDAHELTGTTDNCYILKNVPKEPGSVEFAYYLAHIDRKTFIPVKLEFFKKPDRLCRVIEVLKIDSMEALENGRKVLYPTVTRSVARNLDTGSKTEMTFSNVRYNIGLTDQIFTERYLRRPPKEAMR